MSIAAVRAAIVALLGGVADIGVVHSYERYSKDLAKLKTLYFSTPHDQIRGWYVRRIITHESGNLQSRTVEQARWQIRGFMGLDDAAATELTFDDLIEAVRDAFSQDETLGETVAQCSDPDNSDGETGLQLIDAGPVMFAGVLCHACRLELTTVRYMERHT